LDQDKKRIFLLLLLHKMDKMVLRVFLIEGKSASVQKYNFQDLFPLSSHILQHHTMKFKFWFKKGLLFLRHNEKKAQFQSYHTHHVQILKK